MLDLSGPTTNLLEMYAILSSFMTRDICEFTAHERNTVVEKELAVIKDKGICKQCFIVKGSMYWPQIITCYKC